MKNIDLRKHQSPQPLNTTRNATVMPLMEKVKVIVGSTEDIFGEEYVQAYNSMGRVVKFKKSALQFEQ